MSNAFYDSDDGDDAVCPLCCEPMDLSDQNFLPCPCGYRVCMWCWHRIKENYTNLCPACRSEYSDDPHAFAAVDKEEVIKNENKKKQRAKQKDTESAGAAAAAAAAREHQNALHLRHHHQHQQHLQHLHREQVAQGGRGGGGGGGGASSVANRRDLASMRVVQRNLVYATGLPTGLDSEEVLRRPENFGQYGRIYKIAVSSSQASERNPPSVSAHITFAHKEDALACILASDGFWVDGRQVRSNFGTTKYCATYLRNSPCQNPDCLYLHELGDEEDRFTKDEIQQRSLLAPPIPPGAVTVTGGGGPSGTGKRCTSPFLPPPVYESSENGPGGAGRTAGHSVTGAASAAQRAGGRGAKPPAQLRRETQQAATAGAKTSASVGVAWGGAGATNGPSAQPAGRAPSAAQVLRRKASACAASPTASPHLQAHDAARLQEEWPSLADTAAPPPAPTPTPATQTTGRRTRRKKEKQTAQLFPPQPQDDGDVVASPPAVPVSPPQDPAPEPAPAQEQKPATPASPEPASLPAAAPQLTTAQPQPSQPPLSQPPGLGPVAGAPSLPPVSSATATAVSTVAREMAGRVRSTAAQETALIRTTSTNSNTSSSSMFTNPFFASNGVAPAAAATTAPAPPGFSELPTASTAMSLVAVGTASPSAVAADTVASPQKNVPTPSSRSLFGEQFGGDSVFNGGMFSSSAIGGGLFVGATGAGASSPAGKMASPLPRDASAPPSAAVSTQGLLTERSPSLRRDMQESPMLQPPADAEVSVAGLLNPTQGAGKGVSRGGSMSYSPSSSDNTGTRGYGVVASSATSLPVAAQSPFGATFGGGHFGGAFGSALFPVSSRQGGGMRGNGGLGETDGPGADLSVDPFANSSGALAAMLGVTLPPVDSHSSLASRMRTGTAEGRLNAAHEPSELRTLTPPRGVYGDFVPDGPRGRDGTGYGRGLHRDVVGERGGGHRQNYGEDQGGPPHEHQASRFSFAQGLNPTLPFSPARGSPSLQPDPRGSPGGMGSPPHHGGHRHIHHHHQSHAHRPFGAGRPLTPPGEYGGTGDGQFPPHHSSRYHYQQQQLPQQQPPPPQVQQQQPQQGYSIQNGMAFLQKVLPGVSLSYGDRHPPAGAGGGQGQQGQQGQGAPAASSGDVGWGDNAAGQRVDPAQAFGSSLWTMAPASNAPRQPQGRNGGYGAW